MADYAISNVPRRAVYTNTGVGPYAFTFEILTATDIAVYRGSTLLTLTTDYTVTINSNGTGSVTLVTAGTGNITIVGARAIQRTSDYTTNGDLFASTLNADLDSQTIYVQQVAEAAERGLKAPVTDPTDIAMTLPVKADRAGKYLAFDAIGNPIVLSGTTSTPGTLGNQNSNAVDITGGTINATSIGATNRSSGAFTTLTSNFSFSGQSSVSAATLGGTDNGVNFTGIKVAYKDATALTNATSFPLQVFTDNAAQLTVTGTGNVGIGTSSPTTKLNVAGIVRSTSGSSSVDIGHDGANGSITSTNSLLQYATGNNPIILHTNGSQRMSIGGSGDVYIGTTSGSGKLNIQNASEGQLHLFYDSTYSWRQGPNVNGNYVIYRNIDSVGVYLAWGGTSWIANSDERIKTNLKPIENAINKISTLRTVTGRYKTDEEGISRSFLIAQDVQAVFPEAVNVQGDEQKTLGLSYTDMIPLLTAAIKEQQEIIDDLKARIETLEDK